MVVLVPRQIRMTGMTGSVPYYGGRFTPRQAYAASHPPPRAPAAPPPADPQASLAALDRLLAEGVITAQEHDDLRARIAGR
ncbi:hypothetical protein ASC77_06445 [Nocardioides sp. Root1257]|uniref:hypothetical protein n=1 Tax=unclassified Nocardioides TaxID=2615069 RepID=UPI0006F50EC7|nr:MULTISPECIES: hypothetical protein [unclassified Nocardioides]KQW48398.1 hypothetical protein ASC77_06445 [Nocardioides sp. Root1257]KRC47572.1 hypothetical protein ASE24_06445 [Nocardioides sp. Root224]